MKKAIFALFLAICFLFPLLSFAAFGDCPPGYYFDARSGIGCKQTHCADIQYAHYSYEGYCVCGSSGSTTEDPTQPNKECYVTAEEKTCPGCLAKCVHFNEPCPGEKNGLTTAEPGSIQGGMMAPYEMLKDAFSKFASIAGDLVEAATGTKVKEKNDPNVFYEARIIPRSGNDFDLRLFHLNLAGDKKEGLAFEFNIIEVKTPDKGAFIDNWSIGVGIGAVSNDGVSKDIPGTPISPGVNFSNIKNWFNEQYSDAQAWWRDNAPWYLGGGEESPIKGFNK
jgi:hypothetical protein